MPVTKVLIANRGEIAMRAMRACADLQIPSVSVFTEPDALSLHVLRATESVCLGPAPRDYLNTDRLLEVAKETGCDAIFPGYGFLSENADFVERCEGAGIAFLGPSAAVMRQFAQKHVARSLAEGAGVPVLPGTPLIKSPEEAVGNAQAIGLPILLKATGGGGGIGIHICRTIDEVAEKFLSASRQGAASFGDAGVFIEKYVEHARHIEVQIFGDGKGNIVTFPERECSIQRRHQKVLEETPSPFVTPELRTRLQSSAKALGGSIGYRSAGTVEYIVDDDTGEFYFLEVNTRLQVEHGITEMVSGVDLVCWMLQVQGAVPPPGVSADKILPSNLGAFPSPSPNGQAIEVRVCAEDPAHDYRPCTGTLGEVGWPGNTAAAVGSSLTASPRVDTWVETGSVVPAFYDSLLAKVMVWGEDRTIAIANMAEALSSTRLGGVTTNLGLLKTIVAAPGYASGATTTKFLETLPFTPAAVEIIEPGLMTTVQDYPGRVAMWAVGVPPSGPMDALSHRLANALVGNDDNAAALEITLQGPTLKFLTPAIVAITGARTTVEIDGGKGAAPPQFKSFAVTAGQTVKVGAALNGARIYVAVGGGFDVPVYLNSRSTFPNGGMGGHQGRALRAGDLLPLGEATAEVAVGTEVPPAWLPAFASDSNSSSSSSSCWEIKVLPGPQAAPDYFTDKDVETFYTTQFKVHHNSNRLGMRLEGPRPEFARTDGGEGGSHPSNVHDHVYAIGTVNYTGDMPIILCADGPSLGGFVCPATILSTEMWKVGQARPGDSIMFQMTTLEHAFGARLTVDKKVELLRSSAVFVGGGASSSSAEAGLASWKPAVPACPPTQAVLKEWKAGGTHPGALLRLAGDRYVFLEYGPMELDLNLRVRIAELQAWLAKQNISGLVETCPGVRSVMIEYDSRILSLADLVTLIEKAENELSPAAEAKIQSRILHLPLAFDEKWTHEAIAKYTRSIRPEAPYLPSNVNFVAANNGLEGDPAEAVRKILFSASYMVLGLGDVYLGAPCAVPLDPRHRLVVPKYNPARTFTPEGAVGIGGCYMCIYPMESPGGYQLVGRTLPIWNAFTRAGPFKPNKPWLLRNFDQIRFYQVSEDELETFRSDFKNGRLEIEITHEIFDMAEYNKLVASVADEVAEFKAKQQLALVEQNRLESESNARLDSTRLDSDLSASSGMGAGQQEDPYVGMDGEAVRAAVTGTVWELKAAAGDQVQIGDTLLVLEAMKMEYAVVAAKAGKVADICVVQGDMVQQGAPLCLITMED
jgi:urea carboxylase